MKESRTIGEYLIMLKKLIENGDLPLVCYPGYNYEQDFSNKTLIFAVMNASHKYAPIREKFKYRFQL